MSGSNSKSDPLPVLISAESAQRPSALEEEVVGMFEQFRDRMLRYLLSFHLPIADCEEVVQETFLALFQHLQRGRSRENLRGWLFRVAHNLALKKRQRSRREFQNVLDWAPGTDHVADPALNPEDEFARGQTQKHLQGVVKALPEQDRRCLTLRAEGLRYREIAEVLDMSLGAVSISLARSLARIARVAER